MYRSCRCMYRRARSWAGVILAGSAGGSGGGAFGGCAGSGAGAGTASSAGTVFGGFGLFLLPGGRPLRLGAGSAGVGKSAGAEGSATGFAGTVAGAGSGSGSAGSAGSAAGSEATGGSALSAISFSDYFIGHSPGKLQRKHWCRGYLLHCRPRL